MICLSQKELPSTLVDDLGFPLVFQQKRLHNLSASSSQTSVATQFYPETELPDTGSDVVVLDKSGFPIFGGAPAEKPVEKPAAVSAGEPKDFSFVVDQNSRRHKVDQCVACCIASLKCLLHYIAENVF